MYMDRVTEAIAHFIGLFQINIEEARLREAYTVFRGEKAESPELPGLPGSMLPFAASYDLLGYEPHVPYRPSAPEWVAPHPWTYFHFDPPDIGIKGSYGIAGSSSPWEPGTLLHAASPTIVLPDVEVLGSVATYISQSIGLSDNDYFGVGGHGLFFAPDPVSEAQLAALSGEAARLSPILDLEAPGSSAEIAAFVTNVSELLDALEEDPEGDADVFVAKSPTLEGIFVNGERVEEAPKLEDYYSPKQVSEDTPIANEHFNGSSFVVESSVSVETGGNTLINDAVLKNFWTASPVMAVVGNHIELNVVFQINAWCDNDYVTSAVGDWIRDPAPTQAFNLATFERFDTFGDGAPAAAAGAQLGFPEHWVIEEIEGDLMIVNWLEQFIFMRDNDIGILSSSGVTTRVYSGDNEAYNGVSIDEIGLGYDLIIIGGNVYDANIILQLNLLCDSDLIGAVSGFQTTGDGSVSTSGNLLWNQAYIYNVGGADRFEGLPAHYLETAQKLANGEDYLSDGVLSDPAFAGYGALRVLYIKGDLLNLQYVKQTSILGDSDQLALAMHATEMHPDAEWSVTTGGNALLNNAAILDLDSIGKTYVGGGQYSNDVLVQADIISTEPEFGGQDPNVLVNEAIAFLGDDMMDTGETPQGSSGQFETDYQQSDGLQSMIG